MPRHLTLNWFPLLPGWSIALITVALLALIAWGMRTLANKQIPRGWIWGLGLARTLGVLLFAACLLQPAVSYLRMRTQPPELAVLVDVSQSMGRSEGDAERTRLAAAIDALRNSRLLETLERNYRVQLFAFDERASSLPPADLDSLKATSKSTDYAKSLATLGDLWTAAKEGRSSAALPPRLLLVSDGRDHGPASFTEAAIAAGTVVDVLPIGDELAARPRETAIARVQAPSRVLLASETQFVVTLERGDDAAGPYVLALFEDGREVLTREVSTQGAARELRTTVVYRPTEAGLKHYEFVLRPPGAKAADPAADDAAYGVDVQVIDDKLEVLVLEDRWRWEFKFLKRVLEDDPSFELTALLARGGGAFLQLGEPERRVNLGGFPQSRAELDWFDFIVLGDVRPSTWPAGLSGAVADAVIEGGKSLIVIAGPALGELARSPELHALLPVELSPDSSQPVEGPLDVRLTADGAQRGLFADGEQGTIVSLPTIDRIYAPLRKRPAATVLVEAAGQANLGGRLIVLAEQTVGRGRVLYVGTDALWKWQTMTPADDDGRTLYGKFWQQAFRSFAPLRTSAAGMWLAADRSRYEAGERVKLSAESTLFSADEPVALEATIVLPDQRRIPLRFEPDPQSPEAYTAEFDAVLPGRYRIAAAASSRGRTLAETSIAVEAIVPRGETDDAGVDRAALAEIAGRTGGRVVDPADPQTWPAAAPGPLPVVEERRTVNLWENFSLLTLLCLVLGGDWLVRMLRGYA